MSSKLFHVMELDRTTKIMLIIWYLAIAFFGGCLEATFHSVVAGNKWVVVDSPITFGLIYVLAFVVLCIIPLLTKDKEDILFVIGGGFLMQLFEDWSFWIYSYFFLHSWSFKDGFWSPIGFINLFGYTLPIFWFLDIIIASVFLFLWYYIS